LLHPAALNFHPKAASSMAVHVIAPSSTGPGSCVPCPRCAAEIPPEAFEYPYWTAAQRLLSAWCPGCHLRVSITAKQWRRASGLTELATA
jgi:hypothetical protein